MQADILSRPGQMLPIEWEINPELLCPVFNHSGHPWIDLFAMFKNKKYLQFMSPFPDLWAGFIDVMSIRMGTCVCLPTVQSHPDSYSQTQTVSGNHHDPHSSILNGRILGAGAIQLLWDTPIPVYDERTPLT